MGPTPTTDRSPRVALSALVLACLLAPALLLGPAPAASAQPGETTTTVPIDNRQLGEIIPKPNSGMEPRTAGDPGGWLQVSLFFVICAAVIGIALVVWRKSRNARAARRAAGLDPVSVATRRGEGVRAPR